jgi:hypothetical protein
MKKLVMLLIVLAMCWPCYGEVLVYKTKHKAAIFSFNSWVDNYGSYQEGKTNGFLLLDVDIDSGRISLINSAWWISFSISSGGKGMTSLELEDLEAFYGRSGAKTYMTISSFWCFDSIYDSYDSNEYYVFGDTFVVGGVVKGTSLIKGGAKVSIPVTLNGSCYTDELVANKRALGMATISAGLDKKWTARANDLNDLGGEDAIYNTFLAIHDYLVDKGYPPLN